MSGQEEGTKSVEIANANITPDGLADLLDYPEKAPQEKEEIAGEASEGVGEEGQTSSEGISSEGLSGEPTPGSETPAGGDLGYIRLLEERLAKLEAAQKGEPEGLLKKEIPPVEEDFDPLGDVDFDEAMTSKEIFQGILKKVVQQTRESVMRELSPVVQHVEARKVAEVQRTAESFYKDNPDLAGFKKTVVSAVQEVLAEDPLMEQGEVLKKAANLARNALGLPPAGEKILPPKKSSPALGLPQKAGQVRGRKEPELSKVEQDILDLIL